MCELVLDVTSVSAASLIRMNKINNIAIAIVGHKGEADIMSSVFSTSEC